VLYEAVFVLLAVVVVGFGAYFLLHRDTQTTGATLIAAIVIAVGTFRTIQVNRQGQIAERFTKAIGQLGCNNLDVRLGGIYALERIAHDSKRDHGPIMEVLTAFVRYHAPWPRPSNRPHDEEYAKDLMYAVQAVVAVLGRRQVGYDVHDLDLSSADLEGVKFGEGDFRCAILKGTNLQGTDLKGADPKAKFEAAHFDSKTVQPDDIDLAPVYKAHRVEGLISTCPECNRNGA
jgi:hypothetical protein